MFLLPTVVPFSCLQIGSVDFLSSEDGLIAADNLKEKSISDSSGAGPAWLLERTLCRQIKKQERIGTLFPFLGHPLGVLWVSMFLLLPMYTYDVHSSYDFEICTAGLSIPFLPHSRPPYPFLLSFSASLSFLLSLLSSQARESSVTCGWVTGMVRRWPSRYSLHVMKTAGSERKISTTRACSTMRMSSG